MKATYKKSLFLLLAVVVSFIFGWLGHCYVVMLKDRKEASLVLAQHSLKKDNLRRAMLREIKKFKGEAAVFIKDLNSGWEFTHNGTTLFPAASLAKIPIMVASFLAAQEGRLKLDRVITLKSSYKLPGSGFLKAMPAGSSFTVEKLIGLMIYESDNTATNIVTNIVGVDYINSICKKLGLRDTVLSRRVADYALRDKGIENYTTAQDIATLLEKIYRKELGINISERCLGIMKLTRINDRIPKYLPASVTIAHKTGLEQGICHDAGIVFCYPNDFIIVVLTKHHNSYSNDSKEFIARVAQQAYLHLAKQ